MGRPRFQVSEQQRRWVKGMAKLGLSQDDIALLLGITAKTLRRHFRNELAQGSIGAKAKVLRTLYQMAVSGKNTAATIFYLRTQGGLRETEVSPGKDEEPPKIVIVEQK